MYPDESSEICPTSTSSSLRHYRGAGLHGSNDQRVVPEGFLGRFVQRGLGWEMRFLMDKNKQRSI